MNDSMIASSNAAPPPNPSRLNTIWHWWVGELRALIPARLTSWVVGDVAVTDVMVDAAGITLVRIESGKPIAFAKIANAEMSTHPLLRELRAKGHEQARVLLGVDQVLQKKISLPAAIEENLREVMGFELDRHTPFLASQAYYDVKLQKRDPQRETIEVLLAAAARAVVDPLLATLSQAGLSVESIGVVGAEPFAQAIELLPANDKPARKWGNLLRLNLALLAAALLLGLIALLLPIWQKREAVIALNPLVGKSSADFEVSQRVHDEYIKLAGEYNYVTGRKLSMHTSLSILEELTRISPDTTAVQSLDLKSTGKTREVTLIGEAQTASKVIEVLEQSPLFQNASQRSQTRKGSLGTNDWFHVATELKPKAMPVATLLGEKPPEPAVAVPPELVVSPVNNLPAALEPSSKSPAGGATGAVVPAKAEGSIVAPVPVTEKQAPGGQADPAAVPTTGDRKQP